MKIQDILSFWFSIGFLGVCIFNIFNPEIIRFDIFNPSTYIIFPFMEAYILSPAIILILLIPASVLFLLYSFTLISKYAKIGVILSIATWSYLLLSRIASLQFDFIRNIASIATIISAMYFSFIIFSRRNKIHPSDVLESPIQLEYPFWISLNQLIVSTILLIFTLSFQVYYIGSFRGQIFLYSCFIVLFISIILFFIYSVKEEPKFAATGFGLGLPAALLLFWISLANMTITIIKLCLISVEIISISIIFHHSRKKLWYMEKEPEVILEVEKEPMMKREYRFFNLKYIVLSLFIIGSALIIIPQIPIIKIIIEAYQVDEFYHFSLYISWLTNSSELLIFAYIFAPNLMDQKHDQFGVTFRFSFSFALLGILLVSIGLSLYVTMKRRRILEEL